MKLPFPKSVSEDHFGVIPGLILPCLEDSARPRLYSQKRKEIRRDSRSSESLGIALSSEIEFHSGKISGNVHSLQGCPHCHKSALRIPVVLAETDKPVGLCERQRTQKNSIRQAEDRAVSADA